MKKRKLHAINHKEILEIRQFLNMTQGQIAKLLGIHVRTFQQWEYGHRTPSQASVTLLRHILECPTFLKKKA